ncbi:hypothetical protein GCM10009690_23690 [Brevibacterium permense]|uniref:Uncharacterized protein n=1 Tax=Brevibacterium permense TaxID=234834 RepID=A0ABN2AI71_9MICO
MRWGIPRFTSLSAAGATVVGRPGNGECRRRCRRLCLDFIVVAITLKNKGEFVNTAFKKPKDKGVLP